MIIIDSDVVSAFMLDRPEAALVQWLDRQDPVLIWTTAVNVYEIRKGLTMMPAGAKRRQLDLLFEDALIQILGNRVLQFDRNAADIAARPSASRKQRGLNIADLDTMIAGIALTNRAQIATRNERHFFDLDVPVINPWREAPS